MDFNLPGRSASGTFAERSICPIMRLKFSLYPNPFRKQEYMASVQPNRIGTLDLVLERMAERSRRYSAAELRSIFSLFLRTVADLLCDGYHIHLPFLKITTSISGKFTSEKDRFDLKRHRVDVKVNPGKELTAIAKEIKVQKVGNSTELRQGYYRDPVLVKAIVPSV